MLSSGPLICAPQNQYRVTIGTDALRQVFEKTWTIIAEAIEAGDIDSCLRALACTRMAPKLGWRIHSSTCGCCIMATALSCSASGNEKICWRASLTSEDNSWGSYLSDCSKVSRSIGPPSWKPLSQSHSAYSEIYLPSRRL